VVAPDLPAGDDTLELSAYAQAVVDAVGGRRDPVVVAQSFGAFAPGLCQGFRAGSSCWWPA
jgi:hypothetical protein